MKNYFGISLRAFYWACKTILNTNVIFLPIFKLLIPQPTTFYEVKADSHYCRPQEKSWVRALFSAHFTQNEMKNYFGISLRAFYWACKTNLNTNAIFFLPIFKLWIPQPTTFYEVKADAHYRRPQEKSWVCALFSAHFTQNWERDQKRSIRVLNVHGQASVDNFRDNFPEIFEDNLVDNLKDNFVEKFGKLRARSEEKHSSFKRSRPSINGQS